MRGRFLRGLGGNSAAIGIAQGDAIRNITGRFGWLPHHGNHIHSQGAMFLVNVAGTTWTGSAGQTEYFVHFDASRVVPTANENRPVNVAVRYLIRAKP